MSKKLIQIDFNEALERTRNGEKVYAIDITGKTPTIKRFKNLVIDIALNTDYVYIIIEEVD